MTFQTHHVAVSLVTIMLFVLRGVAGGIARSVALNPSGEMDKPNMTLTVEPRQRTMTTLGSSVTLSCAGTTSLPNGQPSITWLFTPQITPDLSTWETLAGGTSGTLIRGNLQKDEGGWYFCQLTDGYGYSLISRGALVIVTYLDPDFPEYPIDEVYEESRSYIRVPCQPPPSNPPAKINWYKDGTLLENVENMLQEYVSESEYGSLIIFNPKTSDSGKYACEASNVNANPEKRRTGEATIEIKDDGTGTYYPQQFVQDHDVLVKKGEDAVLRAGAIGFPAPTYRWKLGVSVEIDISPGSKFSTADHGRELRISGVQVEDRGTYWCEYMNAFTGNVAVIRLYVIEDITFDTVLTAQTVEHLTPHTFDCQCSGTPFTSGDPTAPPSVLWLRDGVPLVDNDRFREVDGSLIMSGLEMSETGMYQCFCYNTMEITQTYMAVHVKNMTIPVSIDGNDRAEGVYNENILVPCRANGYPLPVVTWFKDGDEITAQYDLRYSITQENHNDYVISKLTVISVKDEDAGMLTCRAVNQKVDTYTAELDIEFLVGKEIAPSISLSDITIQVDSSIIFEAVAYGYPTPGITWYKGEERVPIVSGGRYQMYGPTLFIEGAQSSDTGLYIVRASNGVGDDAFANATISLGANQMVIITSAGGVAGLLFILCLLVLLYVLFRQKQKREAVPPLAATTPCEKEIEKSLNGDHDHHTKKPEIQVNGDKNGELIMKGPDSIEDEPIPIRIHPDLPKSPADSTRELNLKSPAKLQEQPIPATLYPNLPKSPAEISREMDLRSPGAIHEKEIPATLCPNLPRAPESSTDSSDPDSDSSSYGSSTKIVRKVGKSKVGPV